MVGYGPNRGNAGCCSAVFTLSVAVVDETVRLQRCLCPKRAVAEATRVRGYETTALVDVLNQTGPRPYYHSRTSKKGLAALPQEGRSWDKKGGGVAEMQA